MTRATTLAMVTKGQGRNGRISHAEVERQSRYGQVSKLGTTSPVPDHIELFPLTIQPAAAQHSGARDSRQTSLTEHRLSLNTNRCTS